VKPPIVGAGVAAERFRPEATGGRLPPNDRARREIARAGGPPVSTRLLCEAHLFDVLPEHPVVTGPLVQRLVKASAPTARRSIEVLRRADVLVETTGKLRDRAFIYRRYVKAGGGGGGATAPAARSPRRWRGSVPGSARRSSDSPIRRLMFT
jgi:hypothetical protein